MTLRPAVDVAFCCDDAYLQPLTVAVQSVLETSRDPARLRIWLATRSPRESFNELADRVTEAGARFRWLDATAGRDRLRRAPVDGHLSVATYDRLWLPELLPRDVERVLYLDSDLVVRHPIEELWATDLRGESLAAVMKPRAGSYARMGLADERQYFNAGVLLIDLARWRAEGTHWATIDFIERTRLWLECHDQDALNHVIRGRWVPLDLRWNQQFKFFVHTAGFLRIESDQLRRVRRDPYIVHFTTSSKPWHYTNAHPFRHVYYEVLDRTAFAGWRPQPKSWRDRWMRARAMCVPPHLEPAVLRNVYRPHFHALKARLHLPRVTPAGKHI